MIEFKNRIVQFGFGAVGKSFFEKVSKEVKAIGIVTSVVAKVDH